ncbi:hypothetical protein SAMN05421823_1193 [Catalinimonas alkaloidigena]|uniref:Uncharacterized protein n=1 Tax=Catalinimonas alkaloidigena TaxID=1075417 RepID=A0A1G9V2W9_9BACT|nr:hypothetical protein [Catalinimonas alkaloidigena]SDM66611.1 hypothetical protein SAMN05421823_1193 [Catalinimonas alkaloidigena]
MFYPFNPFKLLWIAVAVAVAGLALSLALFSSVSVKETSALADVRKADGMIYEYRIAKQQFQQYLHESDSTIQALTVQIRDVMQGRLKTEQANIHLQDEVDRSHVLLEKQNHTIMRLETEVDSLSDVVRRYRSAERSAVEDRY